MIECQLVTMERFGEVSCMDGLVAGVKTGCDTCDFNLVPCLRRDLSDKLLENQHRTEVILGYGLCERYLVQEIPWRDNCIIELNFKGVAALNVTQSAVSLGDSFPVSPYVLEDVSVTDESSFRIIILDKNFIQNPSWVVVRDPATDGVITTDETYRPRRDGSGNWKIAIESELDLVNIQICKYIAVTVPTFTDANEVFAVKPGTEIIIPFAKDPFVDSGNTTYWFYSWSLVDPIFAEDELIDLQAGEFYKLLQNIGFVRITEVEALPVIIWSDLTEADDKITLTQYHDNILKVKFSDSSWDWTCEPLKPLKIRVYYKVDPALLDVDTDNLAIAIAWLTAAELPMKNCNCPMPEYGFVWQAQQYYGDLKINPISGTNTIQTKYGTMHGQMVYAERLEKALNPSMRKAIRI